MSVFSPLALTQTLPFLPLAQGDIDYEVARRGEPDLFAKVLAEPMITFNYKEGTQTITFEEAAQAASKENGSDLDCFTAPRTAA